MFKLITRPIKPIPLESFPIIAFEHLPKKSIELNETWHELHATLYTLMM